MTSETTADDQSNAENSRSTKTDDESEDKPETGKLENEASISDDKDKTEGKTEIHQAQEIENKPNKNLDEDVLGEGKDALEANKSAESGGVLKQLKDTVTKAGEKIVTTATTIIGKAATKLGYHQRKLVYKKKISIDLPHGKGPKRYCRLITYKTINCKMNAGPVVTLTIKCQPSKHCHHEDTHLFVRFAEYN